MELVTKEEALLRGLKWFFLGKRCSRGHVSKREIYYGGCIECRNFLKRKRRRDNLELKPYFRKGCDYSLYSSELAENAVCIPLTKSLHTIIDAEDFLKICGQWWLAFTAQSGHRYAATSDKMGGHIGMHRILMDAPESFCVDHINGNGLDNRKQNLRLCSTSENAKNKRKTDRKKSSHYKGVYKFDGYKNKKWIAKIILDGESKWLGNFREEAAAAVAYNFAAEKYFGEFAKFNVIEENNA